MKDHHFSNFFTDSELLQHLFPHSNVDFQNIPESSVLVLGKKLVDSLLTSRNIEISDAIVSQGSPTPQGYVQKYLLRGMYDLTFLQSHLSNIEPCPVEPIREMDVEDILEPEEILGGTCYRYLSLQVSHTYTSATHYEGGVGVYRVVGVTNVYGDLIGILHYVPGERPKGGNRIEQFNREQLTQLQFAPSRVKV